jgi:hypothetical protein
MSTLEDQIAAATAETHARVDKMLGGAGPPPTRGPGWATRIVEAALNESQRCRHLQQRPIQPWFGFFWERYWRCRECTAEHVERQQAARRSGTWVGLGAVEEHTCDLCRTFAGPGGLDPMILRVDFWVLTLGVCPRCERVAQRKGARIYALDETR